MDGDHTPQSAVRRTSQLAELRVRLLDVRQGLERRESDASASTDGGEAIDRDELKSLVEATARATDTTLQLDVMCARAIAKQLRLVSSSESEWPVLEALQHLLSSRRLDVETFVQSGGVQSLFALPVATRGIKDGLGLAGVSQHEELYLQCLDQLMGGGHAREGSPVAQRQLVSAALLRVPGCLSSLAMMLSSREFRVKLHALQLLLRATALLPLAGHAVSGALESLALVLRAQPEGPGHRYAPLVALLTAAVDEPVLQCHCMRLVNALVSLPHNVLARAATRKELETGVGLRERLKALHRMLPHEGSEDVYMLKEQLGLYARDSKEDGRALKAMRALHRQELDRIEDLQLAVERWVCHTAGAKPQLVALLDAALSGTFSCAIQGVPGSFALGTADEWIGGVLPVVKRRWEAVAGLVSLAAEGAQIPPEPDEEDEGSARADSWVDKDPGANALRRIIELVCNFLCEVGGPGSEAAAAAKHIQENLASLLYEMFVEWLVSAHGFDVADQLLEQGDLSGFNHHGLLHRMQWEYARLHANSASSIDGRDVPSVSEVAALRREVTNLQRKVVHSTKDAIAARRALRAKEAEAALVSAGRRRLEALHAAHAAECVQYYAIAVSCRERRAQALAQRQAAPETADQETLDEYSISALLGPPLVKVEAPPLGCAVVRVGIDETAHLPLPFPTGRTVGFKVPAGAKTGDLLFVKPEVNEPLQPEFSNGGHATDAAAQHLEPGGTLQNDDEICVLGPKPAPEPEPEPEPEPQPEPEPEPEPEPISVQEGIPHEAVRAPPPPPPMPTKSPQEAVLSLPWTKIPAAHQSVFAGANATHWDPASDEQLGLSSGLLSEWFSVSELVLPAATFLLPKRVIQINSDLPKLNCTIPKICQALKGDGEDAKSKKKSGGGPAQRAPKFELQAWKTLQRILPGATVDGVQTAVAAVDELSAIRAAIQDSRAGKPRPPAERFALAMASIPGAEQRVSLRILEAEWVVGVTARGKEATELLMGRNKLQVVLDEVRKACAELRAAEGILGVLFGLILQIGNYVNGGTSRGGAYGFDIKDCLRLSQVKAEGGDVLAKNMLEFVVQTASQHAESVGGGTLLRWPDALPHLQVASTLSLPAVGAALDSWARRVATARLDTASLRQALPGVGACQSWDGIVDKVSEELSHVQTLHADLLGELALLEGRFGIEHEAGALSSFDVKQQRLEAALEGEHGGGVELAGHEDAGLLSVLARFANEWDAAAAQLQLNV